MRSLSLTDVLSLLPPLDWLAVMFFFGAWIGYAAFAKRRAAYRPSILGLTNRARRAWMLRATMRDNRLFDGAITQNLSSSPAFFASTTILIIGGLLAVLGAADKAEELARELPFAARTSAMVFDIKLVVLTAIFVFAFFRFTWSIRQYSFGALLLAGAPQKGDDWSDADRESFADRAGGLMGLAAESFNDGLRAYYLSFAAVSWFISPWLMLVSTAGVVWILFNREFRSEVLALLDVGH